MMLVIMVIMVMVMMVMMTAMMVIVIMWSGYIDLARSAIQAFDHYHDDVDDGGNGDHVEVDIDFCVDCDHDHDCVYGDEDPEDDDPRSINSPMPAYLKMFSRRNHIPSPGHCVHGKIFTSWS